MCEEIKLYNNLIHEKLSAKTQELTFSKEYDKEKVIDISKTGFVKKKTEQKSEVINGFQK